METKTLQGHGCSIALSGPRRSDSRRHQLVTHELLFDTLYADAERPEQTTGILLPTCVRDNPPRAHAHQRSSFRFTTTQLGEGNGSHDHWVSIEPCTLGCQQIKDSRHTGGTHKDKGGRISLSGSPPFQTTVHTLGDIVPDMPPGTEYRPRHHRASSRAPHSTSLRVLVYLELGSGRRPSPNRDTTPR